MRSRSSVAVRNDPAANPAGVSRVTSAPTPSSGTGSRVVSATWQTMTTVQTPPKRNPPPPALAGGFEAVLARVVHRGLYLMLLLAPLAGYLASSFTPYAVKLFGVELPRLCWPDEALNGAFKAVHVFAVWAIAGLVGLHVAGALKHAIQRDGTLSRMLPRWLLRN